MSRMFAPQWIGTPRSGLDWTDKSGGKASTEHRREVDLYITTENVDEVYRRFKDRVQIVEDPHEPAPGSPRGRHGFFLEHRRRAGLIGEVDGSQEGLGLWIVRRVDGSALRPRSDYSHPWNPCYRSCRPNHRCRAYRWNRCCRRNSR